MGILSELYNRILGTINRLCSSCDSANKNESRYRCSKGQSKGIVRIVELEKKVKSLEDIAHAPRDFVTCEECKRKIKEKDGSHNS